ncbi:hypothetical protein TNCV_746941 [Trichonephila clavipes]|nr:hypothetical protein TNCV_746941 [Trichonephila clavipes]
MTQRTAPWENWHLERGFELLRIFGLVRWGLGGSGHVEGTGEKLSFASEAARYPRDPPMGGRRSRWVSFERAHDSKEMDR